MQIDLRTVNIKPLRHTFDHIAKRLGADKPATRYQEGTFDLQSTHNFHYRPTWDPEHELFDASRTKVVMKDWYALKDPRQFYYATYTIARAKQHEAADASFTFVESRDLADSLAPETCQLALDLLLPLRHLAWGGNLNNIFIAAYGYGAAITQPCCFHAMDQLGIAQYLTRVGLLLSDADALVKAKSDWLSSGTWQPLRRYAENLLVKKDFFELFVAQNFALDGLLYPLVYQNIVDKRMTSTGAAPVAMLTSFMSDWYGETQKWVDSCIKTAAAESEENKALLSQWTVHWRERAIEALAPLATMALKCDANATLNLVVDNFNARAARLGLSV
ncbi:aromatic/alkene monooxygenase hydroxylase subunit beta [Telluria mixta]|uniref:Aromatic/alkene monooxygenase hydroxylase subunit beta n=1 Tax=Telluria mixta TaxID=34071 RepID=A0ABT2C1Q0_9BURK|nr:aromatic/alkene monooxygenase hydroxylase subunit beta [Telluria mixta]MCS0631251.1 aromatic/alkene monooxygenase hydroxylase subunit beta [Telluria mixta]WEM95789.1 aromatic/alkene monooxygenase hydroxylase subunit beta [Telluria mixta]